LLHEAHVHTSCRAGGAVLGLALVAPGKPPPGTFFLKWQGDAGQDLVQFAFLPEKPLATNRFNFLCWGQKGSM